VCSIALPNVVFFFLLLLFNEISTVKLLHLNNYNRIKTILSVTQMRKEKEKTT